MRRHRPANGPQFDNLLATYCTALAGPAVAAKRVLPARQNQRGKRRSPNSSQYRNSSHLDPIWTLRGARPQVLTPGTNRKVTVLGAIEMSTGRWVYRLGRRRAADFTALLDQVLQAFPLVPVIAMICDNDSIHHARTVTAYLEKHPRLELLYGAWYSPHDNPVERIWAGLKNYVANTAVSWPGRLRQIHSFFRAHSPDQMLATAAPWTSPWLAPGYEQNFWNGA